VTEEGLHNCVVRMSDLTNGDLVEFCDRARREFYIRPRYLFWKLRQVVCNPSELKRTFKSFKTFVRFLFRGTFPKSELAAGNS